MMLAEREGFNLAAPGYLSRNNNDAVPPAGSRNDRVENGKESSPSGRRSDLILANLRPALGKTKDDGMQELVGKTKPAVPGGKSLTIGCCDVT
jgi:hypothetical protein